MCKISIFDVSKEITHLRLKRYLPGDNELILIRGHPNNAGIILDMGSANERWCYIVTSSLIRSGDYA